VKCSFCEFNVVVVIGVWNRCVCVLLFGIGNYV